MTNSIRKTWPLLFLILSLAKAVPAEESRIHLLYYFSGTCSPCRQTTPYVSELSREYRVEGVFSGSEVPGPVPLSMRRGTTVDKERYSIPGVSALVVLENSMTRQVISGERDILSSRAIIKGIEQGALTVSEAIEKGPQKTYTVIGWIVSRGEYFKNAQFSLTDRKQTISIKPWLPLEAVKSPFKKTRPRLMSDVINKPVCLEGMLIKINDDLQFTVRKEIILE